MKKIGFPTQLDNSDAFQKTVVRIHRIIALGYKLDEEYLIDWIVQRGQYLWRVQENDNEPVFRYNQDPKRRYRVKYRNLTGLILNKKFGAHVIVQNWDDAIQNYIDWALETDDKEFVLAFDKFANQMEIASEYYG